MSMTEFKKAGLTRITAEQFTELARIGGAPHDLFTEDDREGAAYSRDGGTVHIWRTGEGHFIEGDTSFTQARQILAP